MTGTYSRKTALFQAGGVLRLPAGKTAASDTSLRFTGCGSGPVEEG